MFAHDIISIVFRGINLAILVGAGVYFFNRYALSWIKDQIAQRKNSLEELHRRADQLTSQQKDAEQALIHQKKLSGILVQRAQEWNAVFNSTLQKREQEKEKRKEFLQKKVLQQQTYIASQHAKRFILPVVIEQTTNELIKGFEQQEKAQNYISSLVNYMGNRPRKNGV